MEMLSGAAIGGSSTANCCSGIGCRENFIGENFIAEFVREFF